MEDVISGIRSELLKNADEKTRMSGKRFFKEEVKIYGLKSADVTRTGKEYYRNLDDKSKTGIFALCEQLWRSGFMEESFIACNWSYYVHRQYESGDIKVFEKWISNYVTNWASCDTLCNHSVGTLVEMYPECLSDLIGWTRSDNRWMKRAAAVSLIVPARKGRFRKEIFQIADLLFYDRDDMVQKGYGWMLKATSQAYQKEVFDYVVSRKDSMPRTSLRYAIEKMPAELKKIAMER
ncbi:MAG TPA: DNA alkylation repair protein [Bacteroidales bacterium]|nr:DNA alkylation repair protein [Bacteroidales bacterium]